MLEIYLTLNREVTILNHGSNVDSLVACNIAFLLSFEKWLGFNDFYTLVQPSIAAPPVSYL